MEILIKIVAITAFITVLLSYLIVVSLGSNRVGEQGGGQQLNPVKGTEECHSGCQWRGRRLAVDKEEALGHGGALQ